MDSMRSTIKSSKIRSSPPLNDPPVEEKNQNLKNSRLATPSKSHKKPKLSVPIFSDSTEGDTESQYRNRKFKSTDFSNDISTSNDAASRSNVLRWGEDDTLKLLKTVIELHPKIGFSLSSANANVLLNEVMNWAPIPLSEKNLKSKLRHLRFKFQKIPKPGPESSDFDRSFHELASMVWGPENLNAKVNVIGSAKQHGRMEKDNAACKIDKVSKKSKGKKEDEERDSEHGEGTDEKEDADVVLENSDEHEKDELPVDGDHVLLDAKGEEHSYNYLRLALEEYWRDSMLNMETLYAALSKVNPVEAKRLDESFREVFVGMLKLKMEKNKVSNEIIHASLGL